MGPSEHRDGTTAAAGGSAVVAGIARLAGSLVELPAVQARCLPADERGRLADCLADAWNLAAFTETGAVLLAVLDAGGATIELVEGRGVEGRGRGGDRGEGRGDEGRGDGDAIGDGDLSRATSHGATGAAWGAPPGRRVAAMGLVPGPGGTMLRMSVGLVLRLPTHAVSDPASVAHLLAWHAAMHAAERRSMPCDGPLAAALDHLHAHVPIPRGPRGRVAWARECAARVAGQLALA